MDRSEVTMSSYKLIYKVNIRFELNPQLADSLRNTEHRTNWGRGLVLSESERNRV